MFGVILFVFFVASKGILSVLPEKPLRKELRLSKFQADLASLDSEVGLLKLDTIEIRDIIEKLNFTLLDNSQDYDLKTGFGTDYSSTQEVIPELDTALLNGNTTAISSIVNVMKTCVAKGTLNELKMRRLMKAFHNEKHFYRKIVSEGKEFKETVQRKLDTAIETLKEIQGREIVDIRIRINGIDDRLEEFSTQIQDIIKLEAELTAVRNDSESEIRQLKDQYNALDSKLEQFKRNAAETFLTEEEFGELQANHSAQQGLQQLISQCDGSWVFDYQMKSCFLFVTKESTWFTAASFCKNHGGRLVQIENAEKNEHVKIMFEQSGKRWGKGWMGFWAGGSDSDLEGLWGWRDGNQSFSYTRWNSGEPNGSYNENCLSVLVSYGYFNWNDASCATDLPFICEKVPGYENEST